jgi:hypothetical protein
MARIVFWLGLLAALIAPARAWAWSEDPKTPDGWAWAQIKAGEIADFSAHCGKTLDPHKPDGWNDPCRQVSAAFLVDVLTVPKWQQLAARHGLRLSGAHVVDDVDLSDADIPFEMWIEGSRIEGELDINDTDVKRFMSLDGTAVVGPVFADRLNAEGEVSIRDHAAFSDDVSLAGARFGDDLGLDTSAFAKGLDISGMHVHGSLWLGDHATYAGDVTLEGATIDNDVNMDAAVFSKLLDANGLDVHGNLFMRQKASFAGPVVLTRAHTGGNVELDSAVFSSTLYANSLNVQGALFMRGNASFAGDVNLISARVAGNVEMDTATFSQTLTAGSLTVQGNLFMRNGASFAGDVNLVSATIGGGMEIDRAVFSRRLIAGGLDVHGQLLMYDRSVFAGPVSLVAAKLGRLDLNSATASSIDLSDVVGASGSELELTGLNWRCIGGPFKPPTLAALAKGPPDDASTWPLAGAAPAKTRCDGPGLSPPGMSLRNARFESFQDSPDAWPPLLDLEGLHYDRLGGLNGSGRLDMRKRTDEEWIDWLNRDQTYSTQPYTQLAAVLTAAGWRDTAEAILFAGNERERNEVWNRTEPSRWQWFRHDFLSWLWLTVFGAIAGYGVGLYTFRVLWWVIGLTLLGTFLLRYSPYARKHNVFWRFGACLHRLLPVVELSKEFEDFFDNKTEPGQPTKLHPWQMAFFSAIALAGYVLGFFLLAAMSGLTGK